MTKRRKASALSSKPLVDADAKTTLQAPAKRAPNDRGQGRKPINEDGELMASFAVRMTRALWEQCKEVAGEQGRASWIRKCIERAMRARTKKLKQ